MLKKNASNGLNVGDLQVNRKKSFRTHKKTLTLSPKYFKRQEQLNFFKIGSSRINRYKQSKRCLITQDDKWDSKLSTYMNSKQKMFELINQPNKSTSFQQFKLNKRYEIQQRKKISQLKKASIQKNSPQRRQRVSTEQPKQIKSHILKQNNFKQTFFVSNLIEDQDQQRKTFRCDALMVNLVSNYFQRKMFKKHRKYDTVRIKTEGNKMVNLSGKQIQ